MLFTQLFHFIVELATLVNPSLQYVDPRNSRFLPDHAYGSSCRLYQPPGIEMPASLPSATKTDIPWQDQMWANWPRGWGDHRRTIINRTPALRCPRCHPWTRICRHHHGPTMLHGMVWKTNPVRKIRLLPEPTYHYHTQGNRHSSTTPTLLETEKQTTPIRDAILFAGKNTVDTFMYNCMCMYLHQNEPDLLEIYNLAITQMKIFFYTEPDPTRAPALKGWSYPQSFMVPSTSNLKRTSDGRIAWGEKENEYGR